MDIITPNKEAFSDENQAKMPQKNKMVRRPQVSDRPKPAIPSVPTERPVRKELRPMAPRSDAQAAPRDNRPATNAGAHGATTAPKPPMRQQFNRPQGQPSRPHYAMPPQTSRTGDETRQATQAARAQHTPVANSMSLTGPSTITRNPKNPNVRIIPLGGLEEIGKNMTAFEYGDDVIIVDMGFLFPDSDMLGVDYIITDNTYLEEKKDKIRGAVITHGHLDHIGAIPYLVEKLGFPTMYGTAITMGMVKHRLEEFNLVGRNKCVTIEPDKDVLQLGAFRIRTFHLVHSVPGAIGLEIETPNGRIVYATDWKFDYTPADGKPVDFRDLAAIGSRGVDLMFSDSTNAEKPGFSISERVVEREIAGVVNDAKGRLIVAMFASNLNRIQQTINVAARAGRKVLIAGRSIQNNVEMAVNLRAISFPPNTLISDKEINRLNDEQILVLCTGAQGEENAALNRMANGEHRTIQIKRGDTVIISASPIPGNEKSVEGVMNALYKSGASVIYNKMLDVHTTGHAFADELKLMLALMKPQYFIPLHGERSKRIVHGKLAEEVGVNPENIMLGDNGTVLEMDFNGKVSLTDEAVPAGYVIVDGLGIGDVGNIVLADRKAMAQEGIFVVISTFDTKKGQFITSPDIISRGFIYMRENEQFINDIRNEIKRIQNAAAAKPGFDMSALKNELRDFLSKLLFQKTERQPMVIPVVIEI
jgi:ribonuclease J